MAIERNYRRLPGNPGSMLEDSPDHHGQPHGGGQSWEATVVDPILVLGLSLPPAFDDIEVLSIEYDDNVPVFDAPVERDGWSE